MATLTIDVPDDVAQSVALLPDASRAAYLARINAFAVATLPEDEEGETEKNLLSDFYERYPLPASLTQPLGEMLRKSFEASDEGRVIDGETVLAEMRRLSGRV